MGGEEDLDGGRRAENQTSGTSKELLGGIKEKNFTQEKGPSTQITDLFLHIIQNKKEVSKKKS